MLIDLVKNKVKDDSGRLTDEADYVPAVAAALERYSKHRPLEQVEDLVGAGSHDLTLPVDWLDGFSQIEQIEYPVDRLPEELLASDEWKLYRAPTGPVLRLLSAPPTALEKVRVTFTVPRLDNDIPAGDLDAVACLAASICLRTLAALFGQSSDPTIGADVVNYRSKCDEFRRLADALEQRFNAHLGIDKAGGHQAASAVASTPSRGRTRLTH